jgi:hypothetical protein
MATKVKAAPVAKAPVTTRVKIDEIVKGDVFSEISHYTFIEKIQDGCKMLHHESGKNVDLQNSYVESLLAPANQYHGEVIEVGREDKYWTVKQLEEERTKRTFTSVEEPKVGDIRVPGIRTIWENIHSAQVFTVWFITQNVPLTGPKLAELREAQAKAAIDAIEKAQKDKKGISVVALAQLKNIQENPVLPYEAGRVRELTGYKIQFTSRDGKYQCIDMNKPKGDNQRPVNINTIEALVFNGKKYIVK